jgi:hypothetical protein
MSRWRVSGSFLHCLLILGRDIRRSKYSTAPRPSQLAARGSACSSTPHSPRRARGRGIFGPTDVPVESKWFFSSLSSDSRPRLQLCPLSNRLRNFNLGLGPDRLLVFRLLLFTPRHPSTTRGIFGPTDVPVESKWFFSSLSSDSRPRLQLCIEYFRGSACSSTPHSPRSPTL